MARDCKSGFTISLWNELARVVDTKYLVIGTTKASRTLNTVLAYANLPLLQKIPEILGLHNYLQLSGSVEQEVGRL